MISTASMIWAGTMLLTYLPFSFPYPAIRLMNWNTFRCRRRCTGRWPHTGRLIWRPHRLMLTSSPITIVKLSWYVCLFRRIFVLIDVKIASGIKNINFTPMCGNTVYSALSQLMWDKSQAYYSGEIRTHDLCLHIDRYPCSSGDEGIF